MTDIRDLGALELAALLASRVCHDVISPVGAVLNGLEVLEEGSDPSMQEHAMTLITHSARQASAKLQFARLAFGAAGSAGAYLDLGDARDVALAYAEFEKASVIWSAQPALVPKDYVKLALNMLLIAFAAVPRGGEIDFTMEDLNIDPQFTLRAKGDRARIPDEAAVFLGGLPAGNKEMDARAVQPYFTGLVARNLGMDISARMDGDDFEIAARSAGPATS